MKHALYDHQRLALAYMESNPSLLIGYGCGCGKTAIALSWIRWAIKQGRIKDALIVCPASLVPNWKQAVEDMILFQGWETRDVDILRDAVTIRSYQKTYTSKKTPISHRDGRVTYKREISVRDDIDHPWGALICDESHSLGSHSSVQTRTAIVLSRLSKYRYLMSGTPIHGSSKGKDYAKLYGQVQTLTAGTKWRNWSDFCRYAVASYDRWFKPETYHDDYCNQLLSDYAIVCRLEDCIDMPGKIEQDIPCPLTEKAVYEDLRKGIVNRYGIELKTAGGQYTKMLQVCSGSLKADDGSTMLLKTSKDDALSDILQGTDEPVVVFCSYRASVDRCVAIARKAGRRPMAYDGRSKKDAWMDFTSGRVDVIVCQYQAGGVGLNLQNAHIMVMYEPCFSTLQLDQSRDRIYRSGQADRCVYYYLTTPKSLEDKVWRTVRAGVDITDEVMARLMLDFS